ncbi:PaaI family thioesterase [Nocardioides sp.]|uniref:PaaI family thioesterase n=1 Tax=Nocardioides sp. TaxID=35761 RepID=UPI0025DAD91C|nr:PaaI family thioesterase [Nocardioides sp.]
MTALISQRAPVPRDPHALDALTRLVDATRELMAAAATTDVEPDEVARATSLIEQATEELSARRRDRVHRMPLDADWAARARAGEPVTMAWLNPLRFPLEVVIEGRRATTTMVPEAIHEGPPESLHGGWTAAILDHLLGILICAHDLPARTAQLTLTYRRGTRLDVPTEFGGEIVEIQGRKAVTRAWVRQEGVTTVEADGLFVLPRTEAVSPS